LNRKGLESHARDWADFFLANQGPLVAYALSLVGELPAAEDLIQDVLVRMVRQNRPVRNAKAFVLRCMRNLVHASSASASALRPASVIALSRAIMWVSGALGHDALNNGCSRRAQRATSLGRHCPQPQTRKVKQLPARSR